MPCITHKLLLLCCVDAASVAGNIPRIAMLSTSQHTDLKEVVITLMQPATRIIFCMLLSFAAVADGGDSGPQAMLSPGMPYTLCK
jgi:hypothetical protein